jgi:hypothetical protein
MKQMSQSSAESSEPPGVTAEEMGSFAVRAFGYATSWYWSFLDALLDGLQAYEAEQGGGGHAPAPLPAA